MRDFLKRVGLEISDDRYSIIGSVFQFLVSKYCLSSCVKVAVGEGCVVVWLCG
jgi:hypothetical protein